MVWFLVEASLADRAVELLAVCALRFARRPPDVAGTEIPIIPVDHSTCKDRWVAIRKGNRTVYAQWEDAGPFRTDYWQYVFGNERPKIALNKGAGLDVSPAVRDYLGLSETDLTDWRFVAACAYFFVQVGQQTLTDRLACRGPTSQ